MKVYVDELPKNCTECDLFDQNETGSCWCCVSGDNCPSRNVPKLYKSCPLQSLADYTKQVRKEVCEEIRKFIHSGEYDNFGIEYLRTGLAVLEKLDQIQNKD